MKKHYLIYQITNTVNNKIYIGKHITENVDDDYFGSGLDKFVKTILFKCQNKEEMDLLERCVVTQEFCDRDDTYNINVGGDGGWSYVNCSSSYQLGSNARSLSASKAGKECQRTLKRYGTSTTKRHLEKLSLEEQEKYKANMSCKLKAWHKKHKGIYANEHNPMYGHVYSEETLQKMKESHLGNRNSMHGKMWICNDKTHESKTILKTETIPDGWRKGRICK